MSMEQQGWIKLYRKLLSSPIFSSEKGLKVWVWCLLKATHSGYEQYVGRSLVKLEPGQFVFGRQTASGELRMKPSTVWGWISQLKSDSYIDITTNNKYSVISIKNWSDYQGMDSKLDNKETTKKQQMDTNKNDKKEKNENIYSSLKCLTDELCAEIAVQYTVQEKPVKDLRDDLIGYCKSKRKVYHDYRATLQNWVRRAIKEKRISKSLPIIQPPQLVEISEEERQRNLTKIREIRSKFFPERSARQ